MMTALILLSGVLLLDMALRIARIRDMKKLIKRANEK